ncbi:hypothetical protein F5884DRAFT_680133 [Xylogone sp. PMI_703]|nr:hypothetical protein F5884DRAFT_680133 [Xylogone sp. PMI_703]
MSTTQPGKPPQGSRATEPTRLQSLLSRHERPRPSDLQKSIEEKDRVPLRPPKVQRQGSAMALRNMFSRNKTEKASQPSKLSATASPAPSSTPAPRPAPAAPVLPPKTTTKSLPQPSTIPKARLPRTTRTEPVPPPPPPPAPAKTAPSAQPTAKPSRLNLRGKSARQSIAPATKPNQTPTPAPRAPQRPPSRLSAAWDPPPLFQAFPQAIKYAELTASTLSADSILRMSNHKRHNSIREEIAQTPMSPDGTPAVDERSKTPKPRRPRRRISVSLPKPEWTKKIYVLVTSGYLLQYAGEGSFDRLPEKMMQLGKDSVAFASDAIPGKHWVLQISQAMNAEGAPAADSRSLLSRLNFRGADYRRSATSFLLILNSAEEMDGWIAAVRKEIEALGGKKHLSETGKPKPEEKPTQLKEQPSHRYLVKRDSALITSPASLQRFSFDSKGTAHGVPPNAEESQATPRTSTSFKPAPKGLNPESDQTERNKHDSSHRFSYMSSGQPTVLSSQPASITSSPTRTSFSTMEDSQAKISVDDVLSRPNILAVNARRKSIQALNDPVLISSPIQRARPYSTYAVPMRPSRTQSPPTPNFSVPTTSSRRYSSAVPPARDILPTQSENSNASTSQNTQPLPEKPEQISVTPTAAAVVITRDRNSKSPALEAGPTVVTPTASSFKVVPQAKPTVVNIPARSLSLKVAPTASKIVPPPRRSSVFATSTPLVDMTHRSPQSPLQHIEANARGVSTRKSLPILVSGPPPAPPPDYALPPLPPAGNGSKGPLRSGSKGGIRT